MEKQYVTLSVNGAEYKLKLSAQGSVQLEDKLGCSVLKALTQTDKVSVSVEFLRASMVRYQPGTTTEMAYGVYDDYIDEGGTLEKLNEVIADVLVVSGFLQSETVAKARETRNRLAAKATAQQAN